MISTLFNTSIYQPLYNGIVLLMDILPWADLGVIVILFTLAIRLVLFPLSQKAVRTQLAMRQIQPELDVIKKEYTNDKQKQAEETFALYKKYKINPFSGIIFLIIQLPIIFALYFIFLRGGFPTIDTSILYSFISVPENISISFLGLIVMTEKSIILSLLTGITQFIQSRLTLPVSKEKKPLKERTFGDDLAHSMQLQMRYVLPVIITFISYSLSAMIALYWVTSNIFTILQELFLRHKWKKDDGIITTSDLIEE
jgi:YidC/Oxa1 family membrane protein insertase